MRRQPWTMAAGLMLAAELLLAAGLTLAVPAPAQSRAPADRVPPATGVAGESGSAAVDRLPVAIGAPNFVNVIVEGVPDSVRGSFMAGFRGTFSDPTLKTERPGPYPGQTAPGIPLSSRFRLLEGTPAKGAWQSQVSIQWLAPGQAVAELSADSGAAGQRGAPAKKAPPSKGRTPARRGPMKAQVVTPLVPGARVTYWALSPEAVAAGARVIPNRETLRFEFKAAAGARHWQLVGRSIALLLLETLHHQSDDLDDDVRLRLEDCDRGGP